MLAGTGRRIAYSRLHVVDAGGNTLTAWMEVTTEARLAVLVEDAVAAYPVRIDPTFSDWDWISMGGLPGANGTVNATVVDSSGNLYIGGDFTIIGEVLANRVAKWNGSAWSALGSGLNRAVKALAVSGSDLYVGGQFTTAGGKVSAYVAKATLTASIPARPPLLFTSSGISLVHWTLYQTNTSQMTVVGVNGHASLLVPSSSTASQNAYIVWHGTPTAAEDWTVDITGHNSATSSTNGSSQLQLAVLRTDGAGPSKQEGYTESPWPRIPVVRGATQHSG